MGRGGGRRGRTLYEPINPDRDTLPDLSLDGAIELEQEKIFLKNLAPVLEQANFNTLSDDIIQYALSYHDPLFKSQVIAEIENYEYVKFWALGLRPGAPPMERQRSIESSKWWPFSRMVKAPMHR
ncbi:transmembrane protein 143-like, partial [Rhincodon typus]|uniref:transmembrane protein 143-like n=1 Tax=Rhincodon typus TaxID=259920 RepID=UPI002030272B